MTHRCPTAPTIVLLLLTPASCGSPLQAPAEGDVVGGGWSFGFCVGECRGTLAMEGDALDYRVTDWQGGTEVWTALGTLTAEGRDRLAALAADLPDTLAERYGCPDCADGGAAWVTRATTGGTRESVYEFGRPPEVLEPMDAFLRSVLEALETCATTPDVAPAPDCARRHEPPA